MKVRNTTTDDDIKPIGSIRFGSLIQLLKKPVSWSSYSTFSSETFYILSDAYYKGHSGVSERELLIVAVGTGANRGVPTTAKARIFPDAEVFPHGDC